jgi:hypothetical protein
MIAFPTGTKVWIAGGVPDIDLSLSTLADLIGHACVALTPIHELIERHVLEGARLHGDDTTVPLLARGCTRPLKRSISGWQVGEPKTKCLLLNATSNIRPSGDPVSATAEGFHAAQERRCCASGR